jgi:hypothetical protein
MHADDLPKGHVNIDLVMRREGLGIDRAPRSAGRSRHGSRPLERQRIGLGRKLALVTGGTSGIGRTTTITAGLSARDGARLLGQLAGQPLAPGQKREGADDDSGQGAVPASLIAG